MIISVFWLALGGVLLYFGAEALIRGASTLALRLGMTPLVVGLTVVAAGTSTPEMVVSVLAGFRGQAGIAVGNVVGSNICNILLIAGAAALIRPLRVHRTVVRREIPIMIVVSMLTAGLLWRGQMLLRSEAALLFALLVAVTAWSVYAARHEPEPATGAAAAPTEAHPLPEASAAKGGSTLILLGLIALGLALLTIGADRFVAGAVELARALDLSEAVIGLTIVAIGTSLPELATSVVAAVRRESDLALGNVVGSNVFNLLGILGVTGLVQPLALPAGSGFDLLVMIGVSLVVLPVARTGFCVQRWEGGLLVGIYILYVGWLIAG